MTEEVKIYETCENEPGKYVSNMSEFSGYIRLPHPLTGRAYKAWIASQAGDDEQEIWKHWRGALALVSEWAIDGLSPADIDESGDNVPLEIIQWVRAVTLEYLADVMSLKNLRAPSETT